MTEPRPDWQSTLAASLAWSEAHPTFEAAVDGLPAPLRARRPEGFPHSVWELAEHVRRAQADIIDLITNAAYVAPAFPDDYWPPASETPSDAAWGECLAAVARDRERLQALARRAEPAPADAIPWSPELTTVGLVLQALDHAAYHVGQIVMARRLMGAWPGT
jgi:uncharacterized damage-inducible protein DinB